MKLELRAAYVTVPKQSLWNRNRMCRARKSLMFICAGKVTSGIECPVLGFTLIAIDTRSSIPKKCLGSEVMEKINEDHWLNLNANSIGLKVLRELIKFIACLPHE